MCCLLIVAYCLVYVVAFFCLPCRTLLVAVRRLLLGDTRSLYAVSGVLCALCNCHPARFDCRLMRDACRALCVVWSSLSVACRLLFSCSYLWFGVLFHVCRMERVVRYRCCVFCAHVCFMFVVWCCRFAFAVGCLLCGVVCCLLCVVCRSFIVWRLLCCVVA